MEIASAIGYSPMAAAAGKRNRKKVKKGRKRKRKGRNENAACRRMVYWEVSRK